ncbi:MAG: DUF3488 and transglutaminase-like domain-containing protein [Xanthomonadales bacterium]|nr:DUF3488 and transglutaminase-like domain-containing protein [Xanthomonadales bacterium]
MSASFGRISALKQSPDLTTVLWLLASLTLAVAPHLTRLPLWLPLVFVAAAAERLSHFFFRRPALPGWLRFGLTLACLAGVAGSYGTILGRQAGIALLCVMLALKLLETYRRRDVYLLISLAYFVVVTQFLFNQSIYMSVFLLVTVVIITATLIVTELQPSRERHATHELSGLISPAGTLRNAGWMLLQGIPLMIGMFLLFPRLGVPLWGMPEDALYGKTGISDRMEPGSIRDLFVDDSPAFRVVFQGEPPDQSQLYWRGPVLWHFDGAAWCREAPCDRSDRDSPGMIGAQNRRRPPALENPIRYEVTMEASQQHWIFALDIPLRVPAGWRFALERDYTIHRRRPVTQTTVYTLTSDPGFKMNTRQDGWLRNLGLQLPPDLNPRTREFARQLRETHGDDDLAIVQAVLSRFRNEEYFYSFTPPPLGINTVDDFLFETREGYCEFYSSSFTFLMRAAGIPARVVTGYQGGLDMVDYTLIRQSDAHAWAEVWLDGKGWTRVDPTAAVAPERIDRGALAAAGGRRGPLDFEWIRGLRNQFDAVHRLWSDWVVKFNRARQRSLFRPLGVDDLSARFSLITLIVLGGAFVAVVMLLLLRAQWIGGLDPASREYARFCRKLQRSGITRGAAEGPRDFASRAAASREGLAAPIHRITDLYVALRFQPRQPDHALDELKSAVRAFKA